MTKITSFSLTAILFLFFSCSTDSSNSTLYIKYELTGTAMPVDIIYYNESGGYVMFNAITIPWAQEITYSCNQNCSFNYGLSGTYIGSSATLTANVYSKSKSDDNYVLQKTMTSSGTTVYCSVAGVINQ